MLGGGGYNIADNQLILPFKICSLHKFTPYPPVILSRPPLSKFQFFRKRIYAYVWVGLSILMKLFPVRGLNCGIHCPKMLLLRSRWVI